MKTNVIALIQIIFSLEQKENGRNLWFGICVLIQLANVNQISGLNYLPIVETTVVLLPLLSDLELMVMTLLLLLLLLQLPFFVDDAVDIIFFDDSSDEGSIGLVVVVVVVVFVAWAVLPLCFGFEILP